MTTFFQRKERIILTLFAVTFGCLMMQAQVGINTTSPASGAILDIDSELKDKGFLMPRVELTGTDDTGTITPSATTGVMVYNTVTAGPLITQVTPGFYYWNGTQWRRLYNQGYALRFKQSVAVTASGISTVYVDLTGMDTGDFNIPFSGKYQIIVRAHYAAGAKTGAAAAEDGVGQASVRLLQDTNNTGTFTSLDEVYVTSSSKNIDNGSDYYSLGRAVTIIYNVELDVVNSYRFKVQGREWDRESTQIGSFGKDTSSYPGSTYDGSTVSNALLGELSVTLVRQQ